jgi:N-carbamoylputrescine amidase
MDTIKQAMIEKHLKLIEEAARKGCQVVCLQELFYGPYFCAEQKTHWYAMTEPVPGGPTTQLMCETAKRLGLVLIVPVYEVEGTGIYYNTAAVIDADGKYLGKYRKSHIPHCAPGFWEKFYFRPGNLGYPVFDTAVGKVGVYICYDRHFPDGARCLGLNGAEIVFNPSATVAGLSEYLWRLEQPAHAVANQYFIGATNRVGIEKPWAIHGDRCSPWAAATRMKWWWQTWTWTRSEKCATCGNSTATAGPRLTAPLPHREGLFWVWNLPVRPSERKQRMKDPKRIPTDGGQPFGHNPFGVLSSEGLPPAPELPPADSPPRMETKPVQKNRGRVDIMRQKAGRGGKTVTVIKGFVGIGLPEKEQLAKAMQKACGTGGTVKNGQIEIQGDKRQEVAQILSEANFRPVFAGG